MVYIYHFITIFATIKIAFSLEKKKREWLTYICLSFQLYSIFGNISMSEWVNELLLFQSKCIS